MIKTKQQLKQDIVDYIFENQNEEVSATDIKDRLIDIVDSMIDVESPFNLTDIDDVSVTSVKNGQVLVFDNGTWHAANPITGNTYISNTSVTYTTINNNVYEYKPTIERVSGWAASPPPETQKSNCGGGGLAHIGNGGTIWKPGPCSYQAREIARVKAVRGY